MCVPVAGSKIYQDMNLILTSEELETFFGSVSTGLMHATPGEIKSLRSSAERIALMASNRWVKMTFNQ